MNRILLLVIVITASLSSVKGQSIIHVYVALCDNESQGIVPVPSKIGNGNDPANNLYWGCGYGVSSFFKNSDEWQLVTKQKTPRTNILERLVFKHRRYNTYLVADAWQGAKIKECTVGFFTSAAGLATDTVNVTFNKQKITLNLGTASLVCYVGHDGLMDFAIDRFPAKYRTDKKDVIILACASKVYFREGIRAVEANPLLWTTNLMAPEAYTLKAAIDGWLLKETGEQIRERAAQAYHKYQDCGLRGARGLFSTGF